MVVGCSSLSQRREVASLQVSDVTIIRDEWGIPHVYGKTDHNAVFGVMYAQAEDDFDRIENQFTSFFGWVVWPKLTENLKSIAIFA